MTFRRIAFTIFSSFLVFTSLAFLAPRQDDRTTIRTTGNTMTIARGARPADIERGGLFALQIPAEKDDATRAKIEKEGGRVVAYLGDDTWWVRLPAGFDMSVIPADSTLVRGRAEHKIPSRLQSSLGISPAGSRSRVSIGFFPDVTETEALDLVRRITGSRPQSLAYGGIVSVTVPAEMVRRLAASDLVETVMPTPTRSLFNVVAAARSHIDLARSEFGLDGSGVHVGIVDGGEVNVTHPDFQGRVTLVDTSSKSEHSTHVTGTILGAGINSAQALGMAPAALGWSWNFNGDTSGKMASGRDAYDIAVYNNSWGNVSGWNYNSTKSRYEYYTDIWFGLYHTETGALDRLVRDKDVIVCYAAGNDRNDVGPTDGHYWLLDLNSGNFSEITDPNNVPPGDGPYNCMDLYASAKNVIAVGATDSTDAMSTFSSWGPTRDGRIKPELVAKGVATFSCNNSVGYTVLSGTSMATPVVTGGIALLVQHSRTLFGRNPTAAEIKAILTATATDLGLPGPDYSFGFGLMDVERAAALMSDDDAHNTIFSGSVVKATKKKPGAYFTFTAPAGIQTMKAVLVWIDPEGPYLDDLNASVLVNDLDLKLYWIKEKKRRTKVKSYLPFVLNPAAPAAAATRGVDKRDNIEMVQVVRPKAGDWFIEVKSSKLPMGPSQNFAIVLYTDKPISGKVAATSQPDALKPKKK